MRLYARDMSHDRNRHAGMLSPRPHAYRIPSASGASSRMSPFTCLHANSRESGAPTRQSVAPRRNSPCQVHADRAIFQMSFSSAEKSCPSAPNGERHSKAGRPPTEPARQTSPMVPVPHPTAPHPAPRQPQACASRTRGHRREQSGTRRRPRASGRPRQCDRPGSR